MKPNVTKTSCLRMLVFSTVKRKGVLVTSGQSTTNEAIGIHSSIPISHDVQDPNSVMVAYLLQPSLIMLLRMCLECSLVLHSFLKWMCLNLFSKRKEQVTNKDAEFPRSSQEVRLLIFVI